MDDRNVQYPNRFQLTKVDGTDDIYEIIPAPGEVYTEGTFINKFALLKDATAALFGLDVSNVPDDVLAFLGKYNQYWWKRRANSSHWELKYGTTKTYCIASGDNSASGAYIPYSADIQIDESNQVELKDPVSHETITYENYQDASILIGKFFQAVSLPSSATTTWEKTSSGSIYFVPTSASPLRQRNGSYYNIGMNAQLITYEWIEGTGNWEYVRSSDREAYPDSGIQNGYEYQFLGIPFENSVLPLRVETGSYVGTGTYGVNNPCSLTLPFEPKLFIVGDTDGRKGTKGNYLYFALPIFLGDTYEKIDWKFGGTTATQYTLMKREGSTISWYINFTGSGSDQLNGTGTTYYYYAIG